MAPSRRNRSLPAGLTALTCVLLAGCGGDPVEIGPQGVDGLEVPTPSPDPGDFVDRIDNPYLPLLPGTRWVYESTGEDPVTVTVTVTEETREVAGVTTTVVHGVTTDAAGELLEEGHDWFAQDRAGNVWSFGEDTTAYDGRGRPEPEGSWEAGVDGAQAGLAMPAVPRVGDGYQQELLEGVAEDRAEVLALDEQREVAGVDHGDLLVTEDTSPLEPGLVERTYYAPGLGPVLTETVSGGDERVELVEHAAPGGS